MNARPGAEPQTDYLPDPDPEPPAEARADLLATSELPRRGRPRQSLAQEREMRAAIAGAARQLFLRDGFAGVSMRNIAAEVGCSPMWLYRYFSNKHAILRHIWGAFLDEAFEAVDAAMRKAGKADPVERIRVMAMAYTSYWVEHPDHFRVVFLNEGRVFNEPEATTDETDDEARYTLFVEAFERAQAAKRLRTGPAGLHAQGLHAVMHGLGFNLITLRQLPWESASALADHTIRAYLDGLAS